VSAITMRAMARAALLGLAFAATLLPAAALAAGSGGAAGLVAVHHPGPHRRPAHHRLGHRVLRLGMHGRDVRALQRALSRAGYRTVADGQFGRHTAAHLRAFQRTHHLPHTGGVTLRTWRALRLARATQSAGTPVPAATIAGDGTLTGFLGAPAQVQQIIAAANAIIDRPYVYGGGHGSFQSQGYDCSGAVSYALHGAGLLSAPQDSTGLETFGVPGPGRWVTVYADAAHAFLVVNGRAFDTADFGGPNIPAGTGPRWRASPDGNLADHGDYVVRHPAGL
jgi:peptidoglycan hydrolase-like protein with peptidoglycan-binding domain